MKTQSCLLLVVVVVMMMVLVGCAFPMKNGVSKAEVDTSIMSPDSIAGVYTGWNCDYTEFVSLYLKRDGTGTYRYFFLRLGLDPFAEPVKWALVGNDVEVYPVKRTTWNALFATPIPLREFDPGVKGLTVVVQFHSSKATYFLVRQEVQDFVNRQVLNGGDRGDLGSRQKE